ncbi:MAG: hypothetical protein MTP17_03185 [Candidatus Midichloria sp.]|nr:MAG: hypothetical protein MTP17_03185 [Candidatus Midichloria sp.]
MVITAKLKVKRCFLEFLTKDKFDPTAQKPASTITIELKTVLKYGAPTEILVSVKISRTMR